MKKYAYINGQTILNIVNAETQPEPAEIGIFVEYTDINPAVIGGTYDEENNAFIAPKPFDSWILDENYNWSAPVAKPETGFYRWDEESTSWVEMVN